MEQVKVYVKLPAAAITPVLVVPLIPLAPAQDPLAVQVVGLFVADHEIVAELPVPILTGLTAIVTTGAITVPPPALTLTLVEPTPEPPALVQVNV